MLCMIGMFGCLAYSVFITLFPLSLSPSLLSPSLFSPLSLSFSCPLISCRTRRGAEVIRPLHVSCPRTRRDTLAPSHESGEGHRLATKRPSASLLAQLPWSLRSLRSLRTLAQHALPTAGRQSAGVEGGWCFARGPVQPGAAIPRGPAAHEEDGRMPCGAFLRRGSADVLCACCHADEYAHSVRYMHAATESHARLASPSCRSVVEADGRRLGVRRIRV